MTDASKFNARNPAVKRILQEMKELQRENSPDMMAEALEDNIFEWHFAIRGPPDTEFAGGVYHGRLLMPPDYPFKPPSFMLLTPNGRFETGTKICLSISSHHPEHWQPSWSVRTALTALIAFLPSPAGGAIGSLDFPKEERRRLAAKSRLEPPLFGSAERQLVTTCVHERMLGAECRAGQAGSPANRLADVGSRQAAEPSSCSSQQRASESERLVSAPGGGEHENAAGTLTAGHTAHPAAQQQQQQHHEVVGVHESQWEDKGLGILAAALSIGIIAILGRRLLIIAGVDISNFF